LGKQLAEDDVFPRLVLALFGLGVALSGCSPRKEEGEYPLSPADAMARLDKADVAGFRTARQCGYPIEIASLHLNPQTIRWTVSSGRAVVATFEVVLSPTAKGVKAAIVVPKAPGGGEIYDGKQAYDYPVLMQPLRPALRELVNAAMAQRAFDWRRLPDPLNIGPNDTLSTCINSRASLERGTPWLMTDPPGIPPDVASQMRERTLGGWSDR